MRVHPYWLKPGQERFYQTKDAAASHHTSCLSFLLRRQHLLLNFCSTQKCANQDKTDIASKQRKSRQDSIHYNVVQNCLPHEALFPFPDIVCGKYMYALNQVGITFYLFCQKSQFQYLVKIVEDDLLHFLKWIHFRSTIDLSTDLLRLLMHTNK